MFREFKKFAMRGNVIDLAVGVIIGGAFNKIVTSLVNDVIMPIIGRILGGFDFSYLAIPLGKGSKGENLSITIGVFIQSVVDFLIISFSIFLFIKAVNAFRKKQEEEKEEEDSKEVLLLEEIRDILKEKP